MTLKSFVQTSTGNIAHWLQKCWWGVFIHCMSSSHSFGSLCFYCHILPDLNWHEHLPPPQPEDPNFADQELVYSDIGKEMLQHAYEGLVNFLCNNPKPLFHSDTWHGCHLSMHRISKLPEWINVDLATWVMLILYWKFGSRHVYDSQKVLCKLVSYILCIVV